MPAPPLAFPAPFRSLCWKSGDLSTRGATSVRKDCITCSSSSVKADTPSSDPLPPRELLPVSDAYRLLISWRTPTRVPLAGDTTGIVRSALVLYPVLLSTSLPLHRSSLYTSGIRRGSRDYAASPAIPLSMGTRRSTSPCTAQSSPCS